MTSDADFVASRHWTFAVVCVGALALAFSILVIDHAPVGVFHDDAMYVILAKSLANGLGYRYLNIPGTPVAAHFPPGYPFLLSLAWRVVPQFPANLAFFKAMNAALFCAVAVLMSVFARERLGSARWAVCAGVLSAISVPFLVLVTMLLSEPLFLAVLIPALLIAERFASGGGSAWDALLLGGVIGILTLVRTHGIVVLPAVVIPLLLQRRYRHAAVVSATVILMLAPWQVWSASSAGALPTPLEGNYGSYIGWWLHGYRSAGPAMLSATLGRTLPETTGMLAALFSPSRSPLAHTCTLLALGALTFTGIMEMRHRSPVTLLFLAGYAFIVLIWPFQPSRFFWGIWPLLLLLLVAAAVRIVESAGRKPALLAVAGLALCAWVAIGYGAYEVRAVRGAWWGSISRAASRHIIPAVQWTLAHTASDDVVASDDEGSVYLYTGRLAVPVASFTTDDYFRARAPALEAADGLVPLLAAYPIRVVLVGSSRTFDAAAYLAARPMPILYLRDQFAGGAAFTVLHR